MTKRRTVALCMAVITVFFVFACIPAPTAEAVVSHKSENPLPLSLASPAREIMYFLPSYDEAANFTPAKRLYDLPVSCEVQAVREVMASFAVCESFGQAVDLCCIESISPRAP